ncbi:hypothetical protein ACFLSQ_03280 [Bacteroidota bacterium]
MKKLLLILILFLSNIHQCLSNDDILWERAPLNHCIYTTDGNYIIAYSYEWLTVYNAETGAPINTIYFDPLKESKFNYGISGLHVQKDSNIIACRYWDTSWAYYIYYDIPSLNIIKRHEMFYNQEAQSPNLNYGVKYGKNNSFLVYDFETSEIIYKDSVSCLKPDSGSCPVNFFQFSDDSKIILTLIDLDSLVYVSIFDILGKKNISNCEIFYDRDHDLTNIEISDDLNYIVITYINLICIYDAKSGNLLNEIETFQNTSSGIFCSISHDNKYISSIDWHSEITVYERATGKVVSYFHCLEGIIDLPGAIYKGEFLYNQQFSPDNSKLLVCGREANYLFDIFSGNLLSLFSSHYSTFSDESGIVFFADNDNYLITIGIDKTIICDTKTGAFIKALNLTRSAEEANTIAIHPDTKHLIYSVDNKIYFYDLVDETISDEITVANKVLHLDVSGNGKYLGYTFVDSSFAIFDLMLGKVIFSRKIKLDTLGRVYGIFMSQDHLVSVNTIAKEIYYIDDFEALVYDFLTGEEIDFFFGNPKGVGFYDDDMKIISFGKQAAGFFEYNSEKNEYGMPLKYITYGPVQDFELAPNEKHFITSGPTIWNIETGDSIQLHADPELGDMDYVAVSNNGKMLAAMSPEGRIVVWDVEQYLTPVEDYPILKSNEYLSCYPNPAAGIIKLRYRIETACVSSSIFLIDALGNKQVLMSGEYKFPGDYIEEFDLNAFPQGMYSIILQADFSIYTEKVIIIR